MGYVTPLSTLFPLYSDGQFYWWKKPEYPEKTTDQPHLAIYKSFLVQNIPLGEKKIEDQNPDR